jgi:hypothetical protein
MKYFLATAAIALSMTTAAQAEDRQTIMFASNYWRVTHHTYNTTDGKPMCNMQSQISFANGATGFVMIKWAKGQLNPFIHLSKTSWRFPDDMQVPFSVNLDNDRREFFGVSKNAAGFKSGNILANVLNGEGSGWLDAFASSETMAISFRNGNEPKWSVKMAGSRDASKSFRSCLKTLEKNTAPAPQSPTSPVPNADDTSSQPVPIKPLPTVPIKKPKGESI